MTKLLRIPLVLILLGLGLTANAFNFTFGLIGEVMLFLGASSRDVFNFCDSKIKSLKGETK